MQVKGCKARLLWGRQAVPLYFLSASVCSLRLLTALTHTNVPTDAETETVYLLRGSTGL